MKPLGKSLSPVARLEPPHATTLPKARGFVKSLLQNPSKPVINLEKRELSPGRGCGQPIDQSVGEGFIPSLGWA